MCEALIWLLIIADELWKLWIWGVGWPAFYACARIAQGAAWLGNRAAGVEVLRVEVGD